MQCSALLCWSNPGLRVQFAQTCWDFRESECIVHGFVLWRDWGSRGNVFLGVETKGIFYGKKTMQAQTVFFILDFTPQKVYECFI